MTGRFRRERLLVLAVAFMGGPLLFGSPQTARVGAAPLPAPRYIFVFLADGGGMGALEMARLYNRHVHNEGFDITDRIFKEGFLGVMTTHSANSLTTDSAASATALACGCKARNGAVGVCADGKAPKCAVEIAKERGMRVGLVTTATVYDASPAAFSVHAGSRSMRARIVDEYLRLEPDLLMGGGRGEFLPRDQPGSRRKDYRDMVALFKSKGYAYVAGRGELLKLKGPKVLGLFSMRDMSFEIDRDGTNVPSLSEMTKTAIRVLQEGGQRGFLLFVENENIDSAAHLSDAAALVREYRELDRAVGLAYAFYQKKPRETLILVASDHETGGLALTGAVRRIRFIGRVGRVLPSVKRLERLRSIDISISRAVKMLGKNPSPRAIRKLMAEHFKGFDLPAEIEGLLRERKAPGPTFYSNPVAAVLGSMVAHNTQIYWIGHGHTNQPVFVGALGVGAERFRGYLDNTDFGRYLLALLGRRG